ncbi:hypothetical protein F6J64_00630 [Mycoplasmoides gallisepticum]|nr:hypothetical protein F6J64_00630 [Mycoplasmoides gallisepticum]
MVVKKKDLKPVPRHQKKKPLNLLLKKYQQESKVKLVLFLKHKKILTLHKEKQLKQLQKIRLNKEKTRMLLKQLQLQQSIHLPDLLVLAKNSQNPTQN